MEVIRSNRTERLADALAKKVSDDPLGPHAKDTIVVQSRGMERWLTLALAERLGSWSNPAFPFPRHLIEAVLRALELDEDDEAKRYDPDRLQWTIAELLRNGAPDELRFYLGDPIDPDRSLRLASRVARVFDGYIVNRPEMLRSWAKGSDEHWQAVLWRAVVDRLGAHDLASRIQRAIPAIRHAKEGTIAIDRLHLFSIETLPRPFLELLGALSKRVPTTLYLLVPSSEYVADAGAATQLTLPIGSALSDGHPLMASLGRLAGDFQQLLLELDEVIGPETDLFEEPDRGTLLAALQADVLDFRRPPATADRPSVRGGDDSISLHACAGPMREVQVLHDWLIDAFERDRTLSPEDVIVMTPDLETYAPIFRAVFSEGGEHRIPFEVHDRRTRDDASFYDDFLAVLDVLESRFSVLDLVRVMDARSLREALRFTPAERARLTELLRDAGVRWGVDAAHRAELGFPAEPLHTWRAGLERLFLGFAMPADSTDVFEGLLPRGAPSLDDTELVARLAKLCAVLFEHREVVKTPVDIDTWSTQLMRLARELFANDDESGDGPRVLRASLDLLRQRVVAGEYHGLLGIKAVRGELARLLSDETPAVGFLRRGVTLSQLVPLRSVPFRVVCLLGLGEDVFPRRDDRPSFDRTREAHRYGDRNTRDDDRHSFFQAVLCARDRLMMTYSAPSAATRGKAGPSPVVWELCETLDRYYQTAEGEGVMTPVEHPAHAFDPGYFDGTGVLQSASARSLAIARALAEPSVEPARVELVAEEIDEASDSTDVISADELASWLWHPAESFVRRILRTRFSEDDIYEPTRALTHVGPLEAATVGNGAIRAGLTDDALEAYLMAAPEFPDGSSGALERRTIGREIEAIRARTERFEREPRSELLSIALPGVILESRIDGLGAKQRALARFTKAGRRGELRAWIEHLMMLTRGGLPETTELVLRESETRAASITFEPTDGAKAILEDLAALYQESRTAPPPLLGGTSFRFAERHASDGLDKAISAADKALAGQLRWDETLKYLFHSARPFEDEAWVEAFQRVSLRVYAPLLAHRTQA